MLRATIDRIDGDRSGNADVGAATAARFDIDDVLRTPLPIAPDERNADGDGAARRDGFDDLFVSETEDFDPLRVPLKSGEHLPFPVTPEPHRVIATVTPLDASRTSKRPWFWVWGGAGTLAAAAALALAFRPAPPPVGVEATKSAAADPDVTTTHQPSPAQANEALSPPSASLAQSGPGLGATENPAAPAPGEPAQEVVAAMSRTKAVVGAGAAMKPSKVGAADAHGPSASHEPELEPAAGPTSVPDHPAPGAVSAALSSRAGAARACVSTGGKRVVVTITFRSSGDVQQVSVADPSLTASERKCISAAFAGAKVDPFARSRYEVNYPLTLP
jgi:hypothetical protein